MLIIIIQSRSEEEIPDSQLRIRLKVHIALNTRQAPEVLVFHVTAVVPAVHLHRQQVLPFFQERSHIELRRRLGSLGHAHLLPIDKHTGIAADGAKVQHHLTFVPSRRHCEPCAVGTHRILHINKRRIR